MLIKIECDSISSGDKAAIGRHIGRSVLSAIVKPNYIAMPSTVIYKKLELMLTRRAKAYSSSGLIV